MLKQAKRHLVPIILVLSLAFSFACSKKSSYQGVYGNEKGYEDILTAYHAVLKIWPVPCESRFVATSYGQTHVLAWGNRNNPPLILFHGGGNCALMWIFIAEQLARNFYVIAPDTIGDIGLSIPAKPFAATDDYAAWFVELSNAMRLSRVNIAGISWGGGIALQIAVTHPARINKMVLMCPAWGIEMFRIWALVCHSLPAALFPNPDRVRGLLGWLSVTRPTFGDPEGDAIVRYLVAALKQYESPKSVAPIVFSDEELKKIKIPVYLMIGDSEVIYPDPGKVIRRAKDTIENITCKILSHAGHALIYDKPDEVGGEMIHFFTAQ